MKILKLNKIICFSVVLLTVVITSSAFAERISVSVKSAVVRSGPGAKYEIAWEKLDKNYPLYVLEKEGSWFYVRDYENDVGWIHKSYIDTTNTVITKKDTCNIRSGPNQKKSIVFIVDNGVPFKVLKKKDKWLHIQHSDGDKGWIHESLIW